MGSFDYGIFRLHSAPLILHYRDKSEVDMFYGFVLTISKSDALNDFRLITVFDTYGNEIRPSDFKYAGSNCRLEIALSISKDKVPLELKIKNIADDMRFSVRNLLLRHCSLPEVLEIMEGRKSITPASFTFDNFGILGYTLVDSELNEEDERGLFFDSFGYSLGDDFYRNLDFESCIRTDYNARIDETLKEQIENFNNETLGVTNSDS